MIDERYDPLCVLAARGASPLSVLIQRVVAVRRGCRRKGDSPRTPLAAGASAIAARVSALEVKRHLSCVGAKRTKSHRDRPVAPAATAPRWDVDIVWSGLVSRATYAVTVFLFSREQPVRDELGLVLDRRSSQTLVDGAVIGVAVFGARGVAFLGDSGCSV